MIEEKLLWEFVDLAFAAYEAGANRNEIISSIRSMEASGAKRTEISAWLASAADKSEQEAQDEINAAK